MQKSDVGLKVVAHGWEEGLKLNIFKSNKVATCNKLSCDL